MTINEALSYMKLLKLRHSELTALRGDNKSERMYLREKEYIDKPLYSVSKIDQMAMKVAKEIRLLDASIKRANAVCPIDYTPNETVLEEVIT